jgi:hypothetical protein
VGSAGSDGSVHRSWGQVATGSEHEPLRSGTPLPGPGPPRLPPVTARTGGRTAPEAAALAASQAACGGPARLGRIPAQRPSSGPRVRCGSGKARGAASARLRRVLSLCAAGCRRPQRRRRPWVAAVGTVRVGRRGHPSLAIRTSAGQRGSSRPGPAPRRSRCPARPSARAAGPVLGHQPAGHRLSPVSTGLIGPRGCVGHKACAGWLWRLAQIARPGNAVRRRAGWGAGPRAGAGARPARARPAGRGRARAGKAARLGLASHGSPRLGMVCDGGSGCSVWARLLAVRRSRCGGVKLRGSGGTGAVTLRQGVAADEALYRM